ncbi:hydro-lyase, Fe-S type, tartrate/fumarate subfamily, alpha subunit [Desulfonatronospira thiodismutans ASO3-1]|uniref:Hydro-lyase, Fe-S type, tartrate/fumarate subfamily, alpha subunit n=1 Tax=Desulfonatronospira thiodismutans ASO3-1 TaxID=555779 RepID=D6SLX1_9BACT|nr:MULTISPECIES: fumarate hydratase [Desulfonatronospira]EFI35682.1 hydro-lyase, Fe-S type, tartrate/fumarate subfamily, alpha subunit [Desulfonatronospira thiodismutans ASO3-1]
MRSIDAREVTRQVSQMVVEANMVLPGDVSTALEKAWENEDNPSGREILGQLLENARLAREMSLPLCQDTGLAVFFVELGQECRLRGDLYQAVNAGVSRGYEEGFLRKSVCNPLSRKNTGDNTPAVIHLDLVPGDRLKIRFMPKGGGSENMSGLAMLTPSQGLEGVKEFVLQRVAGAGPNPCPPGIIGIGIGGSFDQAPLLAKKALFRPLDDIHPEQEVRDLEAELFEAVNALGIGPMGMGGRTTCLGVKIQAAPCHIASLPVAVNIQCHAARHKEVSL